MRSVINPPGVQVQLASSGSAGITWPNVDYIDVSALTTGSSSVVQNLRLQFPDGFLENSVVAGAYNFRCWLESTLKQANVAWNYKLKEQSALVAADFGSTALTGASTVPRTYQETELIDKTTYYETDDTLGVIQLQMTTTATAAAYDTDNEERSDPMFWFEWEGQDGGFLQANEPNHNSQHLTDFSEVNIYLNSQVSGADGSTINSRMLIGWCKDEDIKLNFTQETVSLEKGKPSATIMTFDSKILQSVSFTMSSWDPWFVTNALHINPVEVNNKWVWERRNTQTTPQVLNITIEWFDSGRHLRQIELPKCQLYLDGDYTPGGGEIASQGAKFMPLVDGCNSIVYKIKQSKGPIHRVGVCVHYQIDAA